MPTFFTKQLLAWHQKHPRPLPWAHGLRDPYHIWISEVIMQQTRIEQGAPYYHRFISTFPDVTSLATADIDFVLLQWQGLGYYTRARNLHKAAKYIVASCNGKFPSSYESLLSLPGIGPYSAAAIASFAYGLPYPVVDGNVKRLIARFDGIREPVDSPATHDLIRQRAAEYLGRESPAIFNQAIMNFGALVCKPVPLCTICPLRKKCYAFQNDLTNQLPFKSKIKRSRKRYFHFLVIHHRHTVLFERRNLKDIWNGLYILPSLETNSSRKPSIRSISQKIKSISGHEGFELLSSTHTFSQTLSHQEIEARFHHVILKRKPNAVDENQYWATTETVTHLAKPKIIVSWLKEDGFLFGHPGR